MSEALILLAFGIVIAAYLIGKSIKNSAKITILNSPEYRKRYTAISEFLEFKLAEVFSKDSAWSEMLHALEQDASPELAHRIKWVYKRQINKINDLYKKFEKKYPEWDLYNPTTISFKEWPENHLEQWKHIEKCEKETELLFKRFEEAYLRKFGKAFKN